ncbi:hypothetical protein O1611_g3774 [Lasiodiplodia mahajangana]|uniref:Uncharacterized protein n=1 Tax=Lasiodiplodia mahajangana TaxID=1108764 RepID=A0ACC2JQR2_9PEZI|nr:hypothetical protein O1611_g3774 [Lasiodiplodia mahajangana]
MDYTVGWIAVLPSELAAGVAMLDREHRQPEFYQATDDYNQYNWGDIGGHNVVIASLPAAVTRKGSAGKMVSSMLTSFPNIRIGLMVGVGAGMVENARKMRLGDVAVSQPEGSSGGLIQYDLSKAADRGFQRKGHLNTPPQAILSALAKLQGIHNRRRHKIPIYVEEMIARNPVMGEPDNDDFSYRRPDEATDVRSPEPKIFYGVIASGNKVVKDAETRDKVLLDAGEKCICIESEASGLMNTFPCLVIRGISDWADSDNHDAWQKYAAATAAAYAKEFLETVKPADVEQTPKAVDTVEKDSQPGTGPDSDLKYELDTLQKRVQSLANELETMKSSNEKEALRRPRIECGRDSVQRKHDGSGTIIKFKQPFSRPPVVTLTWRAVRSGAYDFQRVYLLQDKFEPTSTQTYFVVGCWGGTGGGVGRIFEFDWIAVEPMD